MEPKSVDPTPQLLKVLKKSWGYDEFRPLQREAMLAVLRRSDSLLVMPTGGGKSLCYQAPALCRDGLAVVVSPLISLMKDQVDDLKSRGVAAEFLNSTLSNVERQNVLRELAANRLKLLYVAPERLIGEATYDMLREANVSFFAIDEAHCISQWGHDFRPHYRALANLRKEFPQADIHAYTATATERVRDDIVNQLQLKDPTIHVGGFDRPNLFFRAHRREPGLNQLIEILERHPDSSGIIYCISRREVEATATALCALGHPAQPYHAGLVDQVRRQHQEDFIDDRVRIIVATVAFGMGIDKPDVRFVVHNGMPQSVEHYQQESGRAGRDGLAAECVLLFADKDFLIWEKMFSERPAPLRAQSLIVLRKVMDYCQSPICRHRALVEYFGQKLDADCGGACDVCRGEYTPVDDAPVICQKILSSVFRQGQNFGVEYTSLVLTGSTDQRILERGHEKLSTFGLLKEESKQTVSNWISQLVMQSLLERSGDYNVLKITEEGWKVLRGQTPARLHRSAQVDKKKRAKAVASLDSWEGVDRDLFEKLRGLRTKLAIDRGIAPYLVFGDASLRDMAARRPSDAAGFLKVHGVGEAKLEAYGADFVVAITEHCEANGIEMDVEKRSAITTSAKASPKPTGKPSPSFPAAVTAAFVLFDQGMSVEEVAENMGRAPSTAMGYLVTYIEHRRITDPTRWCDPETFDQIATATTICGDTLLRPLFDHLNGQVPYEKIRLALAVLKNQQAG